MPKYLIERTYDVGEDELPTLATRSRRIAVEQFPNIVWEHSHVVADSDGTLKSFCVSSTERRDSPPARRVARPACRRSRLRDRGRRHARRLPALAR